MDGPRALLAGELDTTLRGYLAAAPDAVYDFCEADANIVRLLAGVEEYTTEPDASLISANGTRIVGLVMIMGGIGLVYWDERQGWWVAEISCHKAPAPVVHVASAENPEF